MWRSWRRCQDLLRQHFQVEQLYGEASQLQREGATLRERERAAAAAAAAAAGEGAGEGARVLEMLEAAQAERDTEAARAAQLFGEAEALQKQLAELRERDRARQDELKREIVPEATPGRTASTPAARAPAAAGVEVVTPGGASAVRAALGLPPAAAPAAAEAAAAASGGGSSGGSGLQVRSPTIYLLTDRLTNLLTYRLTNLPTYRSPPSSSSCVSACSAS